MNNKTFFPMYIHVSILFISALIFALSFDISMPDDGLRHIAFAANIDIMKNWQEVFPHSLFSSYDPWFAWHTLLRFVLEFVSFEKVHIVINTFSFFFLMFLIHAHIQREVKYNFASLVYIIVFSILILSSYRYYMVRPDLLSGLYIMTALLLKNRVLTIFILTLLFGPFYYLFFLYTGSLGLVFMVQKKWRSFLSIFVASLIVGIGFLIQDSQGYLETVKYVLTDQTLRDGLEVGEGKPLFKIFAHLNYFISLPLLLTLSAILIYWKYEYFKNNSIATFLIITAVLWLNQYRYFYLFLPLIYVYLFSVFVNMNKKSFSKFIRRYYILIKRYFSYAKKVPIFYIIIIPYSIGMFAYYYDSKSFNTFIEEGKIFKDKKFTNKTVLSNKISGDIYKALYYNPAIKFIPSCSVGWFENKDPKIKDIYIRMQKKEGINEEDLSKLINYTNTDIYIHYLGSKKQVLNFDKLLKYGIIPESISQNRIIFIIKKQKE